MRRATPSIGRCSSAARGTVRLAVKKAGLDAATVTPAEMSVLVERILPAELRARGIEPAVAIRSELRASLATLPREAAARETPETVFERLGGVAR
jgi:hypothetical protein